VWVARRYSGWAGFGLQVRDSHRHIRGWHDWVSRPLKQCIGYSRLVQEMLAGDGLAPTNPNTLRATGCLARNWHKCGRDSWLEETVEHTSKAFLGLTMNCAKCHDHKFDPLAQVDYYRFRAFFEPYQVRADETPGEVDFEKDGIPRAFDCNLDAPTYRFVRGDEKQPDKKRPLTPGLPPLLSFGQLEIRPVALPTESHRPGLHPFVLEDHLWLAETQVQTAREALAQAKKKKSPTKKAAGSNCWWPNPCSVRASCWPATPR